MDGIGQMTRRPMPRSTISSKQKTTEAKRISNAKRCLKHLWLLSQESRLIRAVKQRTLLWDVGHPEYRWYQCRIAAWKEVAAELAIETVDFDEAKHKWNGLRSNFKIVVSKYPLNGTNAQGFDEDARMKWRHFNEMRFLAPASKVEKRDSLSSDASLDLDMMQENTTTESSTLDDLAHSFEVDTNADETPAIIIQPSRQRKVPPISTTPAPPLARSPSPAAVTPRFAGNIKDLAAEVVLHNLKSGATVAPDRFSAFGDVIAGHLRRLNPKDAEDLEIGIARLMYNFLATRRPTSS